MPTYDQIVCWCAAHNVNLTRDCFHVMATAYDFNNQPITTVQLLQKVDALPAQKDDVERAVGACDLLAEELLILKPSVAFKLNK